MTGHVSGAWRKKIEPVNSLRPSLNASNQSASKKEMIASENLGPVIRPQAVVLPGLDTLWALPAYPHRARIPFLSSPGVVLSERLAPPQLTCLVLPPHALLEQMLSALPGPFVTPPAKVRAGPSSFVLKG